VVVLKERGPVGVAFEPQMMPPTIQRFAIQALVPLFERAGVRVGDRLLSVNDIPVNRMTHEDMIGELGGIMRERPLKLTFKRGEGPAKAPKQEPRRPRFVVTIRDHDVVGLVFEPELVPPTVKKFANDAMIPYFEPAGVRVGDRLVVINQTPVDKMTEEEMIRACLDDLEERPLKLTFERGDWGGLVPKPNQHVVVIKQFQGSVGLAFEPHAAPPRIERFAVEAMRHLFVGAGVKVGDKLVCVNESVVERMTPEDMMREIGDVLKSRPLRLIFDPAVLQGGDREDIVVTLRGKGSVGLAFEPQAVPPTIRKFVSEDTIPVFKQAGVKTGDRLVSVNNVRVDNMTPEDMVERLGQTLKLRPLRLALKRGNSPLPNKSNNKGGGGLVVTIKEKGTVGLAFLPQVAPPTIKRFANEAMVPLFLASGVGVGDRLVYVNDIAVSTMTQEELTEKLGKVLAERPLKLTFERGQRIGGPLETAVNRLRTMQSMKGPRETTVGRQHSELTAKQRQTAVSPGARRSNTELPSTESSSEISDLTKEMLELIRSTISDQRTRQSIEEPPQTPVSPVARQSILDKDMNRQNHKDLDNPLDEDAMIAIYEKYTENAANFGFAQFKTMIQSLRESDLDGEKDISPWIDQFVSEIYLDTFQLRSNEEVIDQDRFVHHFNSYWQSRHTREAEYRN